MEDPADSTDLLRDWRPSVISTCASLLLIGLLIALTIHGGIFEAGMRSFSNYVVAIFVSFLASTRATVKRLPRFLSS